MDEKIIKKETFAGIIDQLFPVDLVPGESADETLSGSLQVRLMGEIAKFERRSGTIDIPDLDEEGQRKCMNIETLVGASSDIFDFWSRFRERFSVFEGTLLSESPLNEDSVIARIMAACNLPIKKMSRLVHAAIDSSERTCEFSPARVFEKELPPSTSSRWKDEFLERIEKHLIEIHRPDLLIS